MDKPKFAVGDIIISIEADEPKPLMVTALFEDVGGSIWYKLRRVDGEELDWPDWPFKDIDDQCRLLA